MRPSLFEYAGGAAAFLRLARAHHALCLADPELHHPFSHDDLDPEHVNRLAAYWGEVLGGPPAYSETMGDQTSLLVMHSGNGPMDDLGRRFVACFDAALDVAGLPDDAEFRAVLHEYMTWAVADVLVFSPRGSQVPDGVRVPHWSWDGLQRGPS